MNDVKRQGSRATAVAALLVLGLAAAGGASAQTTVSGQLTAGDPVFNRTLSTGPCALSVVGTAVRYDTYAIASAAGTLTIEMRGNGSGAGTLPDPYVVLYSGSFDPANPCVNWVAVNDDSGVGSDSLLSLFVAAGNYVIVATSFDNGELGTYQLTYTTPVVAPAAGPTAVPTLGEWGLMALSLVLAGGAAGALRRKQRA